MNIVEGLSREIARVVVLRERYDQLRVHVNVIVAPQIALMDMAIETGHLALGSGDIEVIVAATTALRGCEK